MIERVTEWLQKSRLTVVSVDKESGRLRVRGEADRCSDLSCHDGTLIVTDDASRADLDLLNPGDIIKIEPSPEKPEKIVVVRRVWEELASPET
jgi:hypothetical protein